MKIKTAWSDKSSKQWFTTSYLALYTVTWCPWWHRAQVWLHLSYFLSVFHCHMTQSFNQHHNTSNLPKHSSHLLLCPHIFSAIYSYILPIPYSNVNHYISEILSILDNKFHHNFIFKKYIGECKKEKYLSFLNLQFLRDMELLDICSFECIYVADIYLWNVSQYYIYDSVGPWNEWMCR